MNAEAALGRSTEALTTPYWVSRVNLFPYRELRAAPAALLGTVAALDALAVETDRRETLAPALLEQLHALALTVGDDDRRRFVLPFKRDVFNARPPRAAIVRHPLASTVSSAAEWFASWETTAHCTQLLDEAFEHAIQTERAELAEWSGDPDVRRSIAVTSPELLHAVEQRGRADVATLSKRMRKSEPTLVQYFSRSTVKVSPFSLYTGIRFHELGAEPDAAHEGERPLGRCSVVAFRRLLIRQAVRRLLDDPVDVLSVPFRLTESLRRDGASLVVRRRRWKEPERGMKLDTIAEDEIRVPLGESLDAVVSFLGALRGPRTIPQLADSIEAAFGWSSSRELVDKLVSLSIVVPAPLVPDQVADAERAWLVALSPMRGETSARIRSALAATGAVTARFAEEKAEDRVRSIAELSALWSEALGTRIETPLVEDGYVSRGIDVDSWTLDAWAKDMESLLPLLIAYDDQRALAGALETVFVESYGIGGVCRDIGAFAALASTAFPLTQRLLSGERPDGVSGELLALLDARARASAYLSALSRSEAEEEHIDVVEILGIAAAVPEAEFDLARSISVFGQRDGERLIVNHVYGGRARYFSRYLASVDPSIEDGLREHNARLVPEGAEPVQMRPTLGFNANLGPLMAPAELSLTGELTPENGESLSIAELEIVHAEDGLRLRRSSDGRDIDLLYTGFLVPHALPNEEMLLAMLAGAPYFSFADATLDLYERWAAGERDASTARIAFGEVVLFRRRFVVEAADLVPRENETALAHYRRINEWRLARGMPEQIFLRPLHGRRMTPAERTFSPKPQHVDFLSRLHTSHLHKRIADLGPLLLAEEFTPHPDRGGVVSPRGRHAAELFFEISTRGDRLQKGVWSE